MKSLYIPLLLLSLYCYACADEHQHDHDEPAAEEASHASEDEVGLSPLQMQKIGLKVGSFESKNLRATIKVNGVLEIPPQNRASVSSLMAGQIHHIAVKPGQYIARGGLLARLRNPDLIEWQEKWMEVAGELSYLRKEYARQKGLVEKAIAPKKQFEKVESELAIAQAHQKALRAKLKMVGLEPSEEREQLISSIGIRTPIGGYVSNINVNLGTYVEPHEALFEVIDNHHIHIDLKIFEEDLPYLRIGQQIDFSLQSEPGKLMRAKIFAVGKAMDTNDRSVIVHAEIDNKELELLPGMYVEARIIKEDQSVQALPESAIVTDKGLNYIFVKEAVHEEEVHFKKIQVLTKTRDMGFVEVEPLEPIGEEDQIVLEGAYFLIAQLKKGEPGGGHHH